MRRTVPRHSESVESLPDLHPLVRDLEFHCRLSWRSAGPPRRQCVDVRLPGEHIDHDSSPCTQRQPSADRLCGHNLTPHGSLRGCEVGHRHVVPDLGAAGATWLIGPDSRRTPLRRGELRHGTARPCRDPSPVRRGPTSPYHTRSVRAAEGAGHLPIQSWASAGDDHHPCGGEPQARIPMSRPRSPAECCSRHEIPFLPLSQQSVKGADRNDRGPFGEGVTNFKVSWFHTQHDGCTMSRKRAVYRSYSLTYLPLR